MAFGSLAAALGAGRAVLRRNNNKGRRRKPTPRLHGDPGPRSRADRVGPKSSGPRRKPTRTINTGTSRGPKRPIGRGPKQPIGRGPVGRKPARPRRQLTTSQAAIRRFEARRRRKGISRRR